MSGPYESEQEALAEPMPRVIRALRDSGRVRSGDPDRLVMDTTYRRIVDACDAAGVELGEFDRRTLVWLAGWEPAMAQVVIGLVVRAYTAGAGH